MLISYNYKFIFFHIAKVAGLSIRKALENYSQEPKKFKIRRPQKILNDKLNPLYDMWQSFIIHAKAKDVRKELSIEEYQKFYKFAFVRNPWDWQVSMYNFILREKNHIRYPLVKSMNFEEYLNWVINERNPYSKGASKFQKDVITDERGDIIVDFVGRYETLNEDFRYVCQKLDLNVHLPHLNKSNHKKYLEYYNTKTKNLVQKYFKEDIELFKYSFDSFDNCQIS